MMFHRDDEMALLNGVLRGRVGRRDLLRRATALGLRTPVVSGLLGIPSPSARAHQESGTPAAGATCSGSITWALESDPANLIPFGGVSSPNMWGKELMYDSLLEWDRELQIQPALAESYEVNEDATSYTFTLRQGVLFHNGQEMTANDVKYSFETALSPPAPSARSSRTSAPASSLAAPTRAGRPTRSAGRSRRQPIQAARRMPPFRHRRGPPAGGLMP